VGYSRDGEPGWRGSSHSSTSARSPFMASFRGTFDYSLDAKNRLTVPARFRAALGEGVVMAKATEPCVQLWRPEDHAAFVSAAMDGMNPAGPKARTMRRFYNANSHETELDGAGRVMVPAFLMEAAGLGKEVVVTGAGDCLEVWDRGAWNDFNERLAAEVAGIEAGLDDA
jgi:MraZ protein